MSRFLHHYLPALRPLRRPYSSRRPTSPQARLLVRALEDRVVPATYTVMNTNDAGSGSLRQAVLDANANPGADVVDFAPATFGTPQVIKFLTALPTISDSLTVNGPGSSLLVIERSPTATASFGVISVSGPGTVAVSLTGLAVYGGTQGGISVGGKAVTLTNVSVQGNSIAGVGGGVSVGGGGTLTVRGSTIANNTAFGNGGGIAVANGGSLLLEDSTVYSNIVQSTTGFGGGVYVAGTVGPGGVTVRNSTLWGSRARTGGGVGLSNVTGTVLIQNSTISGNTALSSDLVVGGGGGIGAAAESAHTVLMVQSAIIAKNVHAVGTVRRPDVLATAGGVTVTADHCLFGVADTFALSAGSAANVTGTTASPVDPKLGALAANGGATLTMLPLAGSLAIDRGANPAATAADQRGGPRVDGIAADIGAVEVTSPGLPVAAGDPMPLVSALGGTEYRFTIGYADNAGIAVGSIDGGDVRVTGPNGFGAPAALVGVDVASDGSPRAATYVVMPPGGSWEGTDNGTYTVVVQAGEVLDTSGNAVLAGPVGQFRVQAPFWFVVTTLAEAGPGSFRDAINQSNAAVDTPDLITFAPALFTSGPGVISLLTQLPAITDSVTVAGPGVGSLAVRRDPAAPTTFRILTVDDGVRFQVRTVAVSGMTLAGGFANTGNGGAVFAADETLTLDEVAVVGNFALDGGGIFVHGGALTLRDSTVAGNWSVNHAGGVFVEFGTRLTVERSTVSENSCGQNGGGIAGRDDGPITILNSTVSGNTALSGGGIGVYAVSGVIQLWNSTVTGNTATSATSVGGRGGGISATTIGAGFAIDLRSSILAGNVAVNAGPDLSLPAGATVTADHSLIGAADTVTLSPGSADNLTGTVSAPLDPRLGPLADYGGLTRTHALLAGSPALNAGGNPAGLISDQRGFAPRVVGSAADIGSFEVGATSAPAPTVASVQVNGGGAQRSEVRSVVVTFSGPVTFTGGNGNAAAAFQLARIGGGSVGLAAQVTTNGTGQTVVTLTFSGAETDPLSVSGTAVPVPGPSLVDGRYLLTILSANVSGAGGPLDGDNNGTAGGNFQTVPDTLAGGTGQFKLYRLFGDATGNGVVDLNDLAQFRLTFNATSIDPTYLNFLDANNNGVVDLADLAQFRTRFNVVLLP